MPGNKPHILTYFHCVINLFEVTNSRCEARHEVTYLLWDALIEEPVEMVSQPWASDGSVEQQPHHGTVVPGLVFDCLHQLRQVSHQLVTPEAS